MRPKNPRANPRFDVHVSICLCGTYRLDRPVGHPYTPGTNQAQKFLPRISRASERSIPATGRAPVPLTTLCAKEEEKPSRPALFFYRACFGTERLYGTHHRLYNIVMRILLFSGKGGVGKTSLAAATGVKLAALNYRTLVMSIDPAHSLADSFDLETQLFHDETSDPLPITDRLSILELNIQKEIKRHWQEISSYVSSVLRTTGISGVEAEELAILPGMEELSAMMYVNQYR